MSVHPHPAPPFAVDLDNCEDEPIRIPGAVQPHGVLIGVEEPSLVVRVVSANLDGLEDLAGVIGIDAANAAGRELHDLIGGAAAAQIDAARVEPWTIRRDELRLEPSDARRVASLHRSSDLLVIEIEHDDSDLSSPLTINRDATMALNQATSVVGTAQAAAEAVRLLTGFDRVMVYRFDADWHGEVIAEDRRADLNTFLGLHYPATDIPAQARDLYRTNWLRLIVDVRYDPVPLVPVVDPVAGAPLDLSTSTIRSVSPIHIEYLQNMGVTASMSVSIIVDNELWGLIACHHYDGPLHPPPAVRNAAEYLGQLVSVRVQETMAAERRARTIELTTVANRLSEAFARAPRWSLAQVLRDHEEPILELTGASGALVSLSGELVRLGAAPPDGVVDAVFDGWQDEEVLFHTDHAAEVPSLAPYVDSAAGVLALSMTGDRHDYVMWFRPELVRTLDWAGDPYQKERDGEGPGVRLSPRRSFDIWRETIRQRSEPWTDSEIAAAYRFSHHLSAALMRRDRDALALADDLQRIMLPERLPEHPGLRLDAHYSSDGSGQVGGDWYDAFSPSAGCLVLALGDVAGHGLHAASTMAQARNSLRAYVVDDPQPALALERLNRLFLRTLPDMVATAVIGVVDTRSRQLHLASAGHPPILHVRRGRASFVDAPNNVLLGYAEVAFTGATIPLEPGDLVVLYSDGLVETRHDRIDDRLSRLQRTVEDLIDEPGHLRTLADRIAGRMTESVGRTDDVTVLICQVD